MLKRINGRTLMFVLVPICLGFLFLGFFVINFNLKDSNNNTTPVIVSTQKITPTQIKIPSIGVDAVIEPVGLTKLKSMDSPKGPAETGWFELNASPGEKGSSVIAGHRGWKTGPAVFDDLDKIKLGDNVYIKDETGNIKTFVVRKMRVYDALAVIPEIWNKKDAAYLNLITCSGDWNEMTKTSNKRLVVFTELVT